MDKAELKNSDEPLVSVVLYFYNETLFLEETILSVLAQDYDHWELVLVDDGSADEGVALAKSYADRYPDKIFYTDHLCHQNRGRGASLNAGIKKSRGAYVSLIRPPEVWLPGKLRFQLDMFRIHPGVTVIFAASMEWNSRSDPKKSDCIIPVGAKEGVYKAPELMLSLYPLGKGAAPDLSGMMVHRTVLRRCIFEELFRGIFQMYEDQAFLCKVYLKEPVYVSEACHSKCRRESPWIGSAEHDWENYHKVRSYYLYWLRDYLRAQPFRYRAIEKLLRKAQMPYREPFLYKVLVDIPQQVRKVVIRLLIRIGILNYNKSW